MSTANSTLAMPIGALRAVAESLNPDEGYFDRDLRVANALRMMLTDRPYRYDGELYGAEIKAALPHLFNSDGQVS